MSTDTSDRSRPDHPPPPGAWPAARSAARRLLSPVERFLPIEAASGIVLLVAAVIALAWANSPWHGSYEALWHTPLGLRAGGFGVRARPALLDQRRPDGDLLLRRRAGDPARDPRGRAVRAPARGAAGRSPRSAAWSCRRVIYRAVQRGDARGRRLGRPDGHRHRVRGRRAGAARQARAAGAAHPAARAGRHRRRRRDPRHRALLLVGLQLRRAGRRGAAASSSSCSCSGSACARRGLTCPAAWSGRAPTRRRSPDDRRRRARAAHAGARLARPDSSSTAPAHRRGGRTRVARTAAG